ncbi:hypothetical protein LguiB_010834 [Lonicera macranthoides]
MQTGRPALEETSPFAGGGQIVGGQVIHGDRPTSTYDLTQIQSQACIDAIIASGSEEQ